MKSLDPRMNRLDLIHENRIQTDEHKHWPTYEVFHQKKRGDQVRHEGIVHAPSPELALVFAKEQYGRRFKSANIWVVKSSEIYTFRYEDEDIFDTAPEKKYRDGDYYKVREKVEKFQKENNMKSGVSTNYFGI